MRPEMEGSADSRAGQTPHVRRVVCTDVLSVMAAVGAHGYTRFRSCAPQISDGNNVVADQRAAGDCGRPLVEGHCQCHNSRIVGEIASLDAPIGMSVYCSPTGRSIPVGMAMAD